ncbi:MAG: hypothetical protein E7241_07520 [Lachnospiraceae bacterium]|nr:hypothetical protein [Lachnospiraceae bacterium]
MAKKSDVLLPDTLEILAQMGEQIRLARLQRQLRVERMRPEDSNMINVIPEKARKPKIIVIGVGRRENDFRRIMKWI